MSKLQIYVDIEFQTKSLEIKEDQRKVILDGKRGLEFFGNVPTKELEFEVWSSNDEASFSFSFSLKKSRKGALFIVTISPNGDYLDVKIKGEFLSTLRSGTERLLRNEGENLDLRLHGITWNPYNGGFIACVKGGQYETETPNWKDTFPKIDAFNFV